MPRGAQRNRAEAHHDLGLLAALGLGPESLLLSEPKLFLEVGFLGALLAQLETELGEEVAARLMFQIGLMHGLRDAARVLDSGFAGTPARDGIVCSTTPLRMQIAPAGDGGAGAGVVIVGSWPDRHEAEARLSKLGPGARPACHLSAGYTSGWLSGTHDLDILAHEVECAIHGANACRFEAREIDAWHACEVPASLAPLLALPFASFRERIADARAAEPDTRPAGGAFDADEPAVHIWGPVMVLPFTNPDQALATAALLSREPGTAGVRVVVIDLRGEVLDDGFDAVGLEQLLEVVSTWGAEVVLTGVSILSETVVASLEADYFVTRKSLSEAIASAFQIAEAQRHLL